MSENDRYMVRVTVKRFPGSFYAPRFLRGILSSLSEKVNATIGSPLSSMSLEEAQRIADGYTKEIYVSGDGHLLSSKGYVVNTE